MSEKEGADTSRNFPLIRKHGRESSPPSLALDLPPSAPPAKRSRRSNGTEAANGERRERERERERERDRDRDRERDGERDSDSMDYEASGHLLNEPAEPMSVVHSPTAESAAAVGEADGRGDGGGGEGGGGGGGGMDVDDDDAPAAVSEQALGPGPASVSAPAPARMTLTLTNGQSVGVQSDKVADLGPETITWSVPDKNVMHTVWNPRHADILAAGGQGLCRIGIISRSSTGSVGSVAPASDAPPPPPEPPQPPQPPQPPEPPQPPQPPEQRPAEGPDQGQEMPPADLGHDPKPKPDPWRGVDVLDPSDHLSMVTAMAWSPDGEVFAVATQADIAESTGTVTLRSKSGESIEELPSAHDMILKFLWSPSGTYLLWIAASGRDSSALVVWNVQSAQALSPFPLDSLIMDAAWADDRKFALCGPNVILEALIEGDAVVIRHNRTEFDGEARWTNIQIDPLTHTTAVVVEERGILGIIDTSGELHQTTAHDAEITALVFQPVPHASSPSSSSPRLLVTSSLDGSIKVWDARNPFTTIHVLSIGHSAPALAISFTPDGHLLAAAHWHRIMIWNAEAGGLPKAAWKGELSKWQSLVNGVDKDSGIGEEDDVSTHSLSWDADGKKLAYGLGSQVWVIS